MPAKRKPAPAKEYTNEEIEEIAQRLIEQASGLAASEFKKLASATHKGFEARILEAANLLAARHEVYRWSSAKKLRFFSKDPFEALPKSVAAQLAKSPLPEKELMLRLEREHRGFGELFKDWAKGALARGELYVVPPLPGTKTKRLSNNPDVADVLKKVLAELKKVLTTPLGQRVPKSQILACIAADLGITLRAPAPAPAPALSPAPAPVQPNPKELFLEQLRLLAEENRGGTLLPVRLLRPRLALTKEQFDQVALELARDQAVTLHLHDFPDSLSDSEREQCVSGKSGSCYHGIALRGVP